MTTKDIEPGWMTDGDDPIESRCDKCERSRDDTLLLHDGSAAICIDCYAQAMRDAYYNRDLEGIVEMTRAVLDDADEDERLIIIREFLGAF